MKNALMISALGIGLALGFGGVAAASDDDDKRSDFTLFDGTNPDNRDATGRTGLLCGVSNRNQTALVAKSFTYHFAVTNFDSVSRECKVIYVDRDFVRYKIPADTSFSFSQAAGSNANDAAVRLSCDTNVAGAGSAQGTKRVFCVSCDQTSSGDAFCDAIIPN